MSDKDELAALKKKVEELEAKVSPPKSTFVPMTDAEHRDMVHQMNERRMSLASNFHPDDLRAMEAACPTPMMKEIALRDARAPTGRPGMIPNSQQASSGGGAAPVNKSGWVDAAPIGPPPGIDLIDRAVNAALPHGPEWGKQAEKKE